MQTISAAIIDHHPIVCEGLSHLLSHEPDFNVCGQARDARAALALIDAKSPDVAVIDTMLDGGDGLDLIRRIRQRRLPARILAWSMLDESLYAERALKAGALGYINKQAPTKTILAALRQVSAGNIFVSDSISNRLLCQVVGGHSPAMHSRFEALSDRELGVFRLIGIGATTAEIARKLHLSIKTVETHRARIKAKLELTDTAKLAREAAEWVLTGA